MMLDDGESGEARDVIARVSSNFIADIENNIDGNDRSTRLRGNISARLAGLHGIRSQQSAQQRHRRPSGAPK